MNNSLTIVGIICLIIMLGGCGENRNQISKVNYSEFGITSEADSLFRAAKKMKLTKERRLDCVKIGQEFVREKLHFANSALFSKNIHFASGENACAILGNVTTTNHFGVSMQHKYQVVIKYNGGSWANKTSWRSDNIVIRWIDGGKGEF